MRAQLSVVIPVYDNWWLTARVLRELEGMRAGCAVGFETIVVDNASTDETPRAIATFPWVRYSRLEGNRNFAGACNVGARLADAPLVLFLNNDAYPLGDAFAPLVRAFDREDVAIAGGALFFEDGPVQCAGFSLLPNAHWHASYRNHPPGLPAVTRSRDVLGVSGGAMAVRTAWYVENGGFDESYVNGYEDVDLCMRAREQKLIVRYVAEARFSHYEAASQGRFDREAENEIRFYRRWSQSFEGVPRVALGDLRGIRIASGCAAGSGGEAALNDLEAALRAFGHPIVRGPERVWESFDRRYRGAPSLEWFTSNIPAPGVSIFSMMGSAPVMQTHGAAELWVPALPCADIARIQALPVRASCERECTTVALAGFERLPEDGVAEVIAAFDELRARDGTSRFVLLVEDEAAGAAGAFAARFEGLVDVIPLLGHDVAAPIDVACVVQAGGTDVALFGNVLLAQTELPAVVRNCDALRELLKPDVCLRSPGFGIAADVVKLLADPRARERYARTGAADARRRFSPRRTAIRTVDLLRTARFGLERPAKARSNTPL